MFAAVDIRVCALNACEVSSANLERSYRRAPKGPGDGDTTEGAGICHLCLCGQGVDWEDLLLVGLMVLVKLDRDLLALLVCPYNQNCFG